MSRFPPDPNFPNFPPPPPPKPKPIVVNDQPRPPTSNDHGGSCLTFAMCIMIAMFFVLIILVAIYLKDRVIFGPSPTVTPDPVKPSIGVLG
ncbi:uncharacterized protein CELE_Y22D7AL.3 [Caenorhabditis elegans]|uniref:Uncharacterized protein n=1 Tax=Caenorhabditis elegans TaxID=6239 RepID=Q965P7_CAEEL|nr:Uncharacterized protein CELE_Y22D7AL.3 [Caenorhabditis elegans]CCD73744.1 Uncharacterized protein CELE_Y22D7AL.3 [Caenorhabditis elegans]|eukprot:NP_497432.1 Uncharacterized protein CELE_Y22D7AL.3 [Caenorhabditis elegans]